MEGLIGGTVQPVQAWKNGRKNYDDNDDDFENDNDDDFDPSSSALSAAERN